VKNMKVKYVLIALVLILNTALSSELIEGEKKIVFETKNMFGSAKDQTVDAIQGFYEVPENRNKIDRNKKDSKTLTISYVRFPATGKNPGSPIVYLAGGPGGSGIDTAKYYGRFPLFMALREFGDVIALDQRGTGASNSTPECHSSQIVSHDTFVEDEVYIQQHQQALKECLKFWKTQGVDVFGYTTPENVQDLEALRVHLGAEKISLWGISYGSHLALAALKMIDDKIDKVILASSEGLDQTIKYPARTDVYFNRLQNAINTQPQSQQMFPDVVALIQRVHKKLDEQPLKLELPMKDGTTFEYLLHRRELQEFASGSISDPSRAKRIIQLYGAIDMGIYQPVIAVLQKYFKAGESISYKPMSIAMDLASGMSKKRRSEVEEQAKTALLKDYLNFTYHLTDVLPEIDLGEEFRNAPISNVPTLLLSGTLDGRTYIESQLESVAGLKNLTAITIENAGHNLFMSSPKVTETILKFMQDGEIKDKTITIDLPDFSKF
jgi:pimeloyl-ACP methyl ester carboxylesterase